MDDLVLVKLTEDFGYGSLDGLFICQEKYLQRTYGVKKYLHEYFGKHSEYLWTIEEDSFEIVSRDREYIMETLRVFGRSSLAGYNVFDMLEDDFLEDHDGNQLDLGNGGLDKDFKLP